MARSPSPVNVDVGAEMARVPSNDRLAAAGISHVHGGGADYLHTLIAKILDQHHAYLKHELPALEALLRGIIDLESGTFRARASDLLPLFLRFRKELEGHMGREEVTLFPLIERLEAAIAEGRPAPRNSFGPLANAIQFMNEDHGFENKLLGMMAAITDGFAIPPGTSEGYADLMDRLKAMKLDLAEHIRKEDEMLFPEAIRLEKGEHLSE